MTGIDEARARLPEVGRDLHARGWVPATSGNFSLRLADGSVAITASGSDKGRLGPADIITVDIDGRPRDARRPSAETALHLQLYRRDPAIGAVLHTHSVNATAASMRNPQGLRFADLEILKAFPGIDTHEATLDLPVFANDQNVSALAARVEEHMQAHGQGYAYLIAGHGVYTWAADTLTCLRQLEALEYLFDYHRLMIAETSRG